MRSRVLTVVMGLAVALACAQAHVTGSAQAARAAAPAARLKVEVVARYPHDPSAFTQGLVLDGKTLYESTGLEGQSTLRRVDLDTGRVLQQTPQAASIFSEGLAVIGPHLVQLTWKNGLVYQYDKQTLKRTREWGYSGEGWGACHDGRALVTSDGSTQLAFRDPATMAVQRKLVVMLGGAPVDDLNELECVGTTIYANVWNTDTIVSVEAATGAVTAVIDAAGLLTPAERARTDVLNGIAYDASTKTFLITGKLWPTLFRVRFVARSTARGEPGA